MGHVEEFTISQTFVIIEMLFMFAGTYIVMDSFLPETHEYSWDDAPIALITSAICLLIFGAFCVIKWKILPSTHKKWEMNEVERCKLDLLVGFGGFFTCSMIPKILMFVTGWNRFIIIFPAFFSFSLIFFFFQYGQGRTIKKLDDKKDIYTYRMVFSFGAQFLFLIPTIRYDGPFESEDRKYFAIMFHIIFSVICAVSAPELLAVLAEEFELRSAESRAKLEEKDASRKKPTVTHLDNANDIFMYCYTFFAVLATIFAGFHGFLTPWNSEIIWKIGISCVIVGGLLIMLKLAVLLCFGLFGIENLGKCRAKLVIGLGGCVLSGLVARISIFYIELDYLNLFLSQYLPLITAISFFHLFICGFRKTCNLNYANNSKSVYTLIGVHIITFLISLRLEMSYQDQVHREVIVASQIFFFGLLTTSTVDLVVVLLDGLYAHGESFERVKAKKMEKKIEKKRSVLKKQRLECPTCKLDYSDAKTPRILRECGHTVCEGCINSKLGANKFITCPTCFVVTVISGSASSLAKNYSVLDVVEQITNKI